MSQSAPRRARGSMTCDRCGADGARHLGRGGALCSVCAGMDAADHLLRDSDELSFRGLTSGARVVLALHIACSVAIMVLSSRGVDADARFVIWPGLAVFGGVIPAAIGAPHRWGPFVVVGFHVVLAAAIFGGLDPL